MFEYTQTNLDPGNCWQTVIACVLEVPPESLPDQSICDHWDKHDPEDPNTWRTVEPYYQDELGAYLEKHHGLRYTSLAPHIMSYLQVPSPGYHFLSGDTVRTPTSHRRHVVIARYGDMVWDPHPSRAGLTTIHWWSFLIPTPDKYRSMLPCHCPECGGYPLPEVG